MGSDPVDPHGVIVHAACMRNGIVLGWSVLIVVTPAQGWTQRVVAGPSARGFTSAAHDLVRGVTVMFGGWTGSAALGDLWEWNGTSWTQRLTASAPMARCCHALGADLGRARVVVFGGADASLTDLDDTWEWDGAAWSQASPALRPAPRRMTTLAYDPVRGAMLLFGGGVGGNGTTMFGDTWSWNGAQWVQLAPPTSPSPRWAHALAADLVRQRVVLYGGTTQFAWVGGTWLWNGVTWRQVGGTQTDQTLRAAIATDMQRGLSLTTSPAANTWLFDGQNWHQVTAGSPSGRESHALAYDLVRDRFVLFGGWLTSALGDTWEFDPTGLAWWAATGSGCVGSLGTPELAATSRPVIGQPLGMRVIRAPGGVALALGQSGTQWNGSPLPASLAGFGMPGCDLWISPDHFTFANATGGSSTVTWFVPQATALVGAALFAQALVLSPGTNATGAVVSNAGRLVVGSF